VRKFSQAGIIYKYINKKINIAASSFIRTVTVGIGITPIQRFYALADYNRRSGISPCPEDIFIQIYIYYTIFLSLSQLEYIRVN